MLASGFAAETFDNPIVVLFASSVSFYMWINVIKFILAAYDRQKNVTERNFVLVCWSSFPVIFVLNKIGMIVDKDLENTYNICEVLVKLVASNVIDAIYNIHICNKLQKRPNLLEEIIPPPFIDDIIEKLPKKFLLHENLVVMFSDIVDYTSMSSESRTEDVVLMLTNIFERFDEIALERGITKVETIGDAYMSICVGSQASSMILAADDMIRAVRSIYRPVTRGKHVIISTEYLRVRIGIHVGQVYSGVITRLMPRYCYIGDTVNTASRMQSGGEPMRIHVSDALKTMLESADDAAQPRFLYEFAKEQIYKGKGWIKTWFVKIIDQST